MKYFASAALALGLCFYSTGNAAAVTPEEQTARLVDFFHTSCGEMIHSPNTLVETAAARAKKAGMVEHFPENELPDGIPVPRKFFLEIDGHEMSIMVSENPARCNVVGDGIDPALIGPATEDLAERLRASGKYRDVSMNSKQDEQSLGKVHHFIHAPAKNGSYFMYMFAGGLPERPDGAFLFVEHKQPPSLPDAFVADVLGDAADLPAAQRNSQIALRLFKNACIDRFGDFAAAQDWARAHMEPDTKLGATETMSSWQVRDGDGHFRLMLADDTKSFCMLSGGTVDGNSLHDSFNEMQASYAAGDGYRTAANPFTGQGKKSNKRPNDMPPGVSYYNGATFYAPDQQAGMDVVVSTKPRENGYTSLVMDIKQLKTAKQ